MPKFEKFEIEKIPNISCIGSVELGGRDGLEVRTAKTGSGYTFVRMAGVPAPRTEGIPMASNFMIHPDWLEPGFDPAALQVSIRDRARAKAVAKTTPDDQLPSDVREVLRLSSLNAMCQRNFYNQDGRPSTLQSLLGDAYATFETEGLTPEEFFQRVAAHVAAEASDVLFIYEGQQSKDQDGELSNRLELTSLWRVETKKDVEAYLNSAKRRKIDMLWLPEQIEG